MPLYRQPRLGKARFGIEGHYETSFVARMLHVPGVRPMAKRKFGTVSDRVIRLSKSSTGQDANWTIRQLYVKKIASVQPGTKSIGCFRYRSNTTEYNKQI